MKAKIPAGSPGTITFSISTARINFLVFLLVVVFACSCGSGLKTAKRNVRPVTLSYSGLIDNHPYEVKNSGYRHQTLLNLFEVHDSVQGRVSLSFNKNSGLVLTWMTTGRTKTITFEGEFRRGYYEVFLRNKRTEIPPFLPILYSQVDVKRLRLILTPENNLLVDDTWQHTGNIFVLAGGGSGRTQSFFRAESSAIPAH